MKRSVPYIAAFVLLPLFLAMVLLPLSNRVSAQQGRIGTSVTVGTTVAPPKLDFLSPMESEMIAEMNLARAKPQEYIVYLEQVRRYYSGNQLSYPGRRPMTTVEGVAAVDEAINFLRSASPLPPLNVFRGLSLAARDHVRDLGLTGNTGHRGTDGSTPNDRASRYGEWLNTVGENIVYQSAGNAREAVTGMLIDDGISNRGHRKNIFSPTYRAAGIALGTPSQYGTMCVITYAGGFTERAGSSNTNATARPAARQY